MEKQKEIVRFPGWIIVNIAIAIAFAVTLVIYIFCRLSNEWVGLACWFLILILLIFSISVGMHFYLKLKKLIGFQQQRSEELIKEKELEKYLADKRHEYQLEAMKFEIRMKELELEKLKIEKKKG